MSFVLCHASACKICAAQRQGFLVPARFARDISIKRLPRAALGRRDNREVHAMLTNYIKKKKSKKPKKGCRP